MFGQCNLFLEIRVLDELVELSDPIFVGWRLIMLFFNQFD